MLHIQTKKKGIFELFFFNNVFIILNIILIYIGKNTFNFVL